MGLYERFINNQQPPAWKYKFQTYEEAYTFCCPTDFIVSVLVEWYFVI